MAAGLGAALALALAVVVGAATGGTARASELDANRAWGLFAGLCPQLATSPATARLTGLPEGGEMELATTADGWSSQGSVAFPALEGGAVRVAVALFGLERYDLGVFGHCTLQVMGRNGPALSGVERVVEARIGDLLGTEIERNGGPMIGGVGAQIGGHGGGAAYGWRQPGFPSPLSVKLQIVGPMTLLTLARFAPAEGG